MADNNEIESNPDPKTLNPPALTFVFSSATINHNFASFNVRDDIIKFNLTMKRFIYCFIVLLVCSACEKSLANLELNEWFRNLQRPCSEESVCKTYVHRAVYKHMTVYYSTLSGALCDPYFSAVLYNEDGVIVRTYSGPGDLHVMEAEITNSKIIWRCDRH